MIIDLHLHTSMSDGSDTPFDLAEKLKNFGNGIFSITDHDDLRANEIILSKNYPGKFISGIEFSSVFEGRSLHLLCYNFDINSQELRREIEEGRAMRRARLLALFDHLKTKHRIVIPKADQAEILSRVVPGKVHIADAAMKLNLNMTRQQFFDNCLDDLETREFKVHAQKVIQATHAAGGLVSVAHPIEIQKEYGLDFARLADLIKRLKTGGLDALEVYHSSHQEPQIQAYRKIAAQLNLLISGGSDYHGTNKKVKIAQLNNYGYMPDQTEITILKKFGI